MAREDYTKAERAAWAAARYAGEVARGQHAAKINALPRYDKATMDFFGPHGKSAKLINEPIAETVKAKQHELDRLVVSKVKKGQTLHADIDSDCLSELSWRDGVAYYSFWKRDSGGYSTPMDKSEWLAWVEFDFPGAGVYGNKFVFE
jgi:hypothetical protein